MNSKFLKLYNILMEEIQDDHIFEFENMKLAIVPGSFKPPHKGHWEMIMNYVNKVDKVIILISNISTKAISSRPLSQAKLRDFEKIKEYITINYSNNIELMEKFNVNIENLSFNDLKEIFNFVLNLNLQDDKLNKLIVRYLDKLNKGLFVSIRKTSNNIEITPEMSKEIFELFAKAYGVQNKVDIRISEFASPIIATYSLITNNCKNCKIILGVSTKGGDESRWNDFKQNEDNLTNTVIVLPMNVHTMLSATQLRENITNLQKDWFPNKLTSTDFEKIKSILNK